MQLLQVLPHKVLSGCEKNRQAAEQAMERHLRSVHAALQEYEHTLKSQVAQAFRRQDEKLSTIEQQISEGLNELCINEGSL